MCSRQFRTQLGQTTLQFLQQQLTFLQTTLEQGDKGRGVSLAASLKGIVHVRKGLGDGDQVFGTVEAGLFQVVE